MNPAYKTTVFETEQRTYPAEFAIITAHNPEGKTHTVAENDSLSLKLLRDHHAQAFESFRVTGMSPDGAHREAGYGIICSLDAAVQLGRKYKQEAIFQIVYDQLSLIDLKDLKAHALGSFKARCKQ